MKFAKYLVMAFVSLLIALALAQPGLADMAPIQPAAPLNVSLSFSPNTVPVNAQTTGAYSIIGGTQPFTIWMNNTPSGCNPQSVPFTTPNASGSFTCNPTVTGNFNIHVDVVDSLGNRGSTSTPLTVTAQSGGGGSSGNNQTGGIDLSFLQNLLPVLMITGILFLASTVAIAASAVALAILVPKRLKQLRKAIEGQPVRKAEPAETPTEKPKDQPPEQEP